MVLQTFQNNLGFSLCTTLSICCLVTILKVGVKFNKRSTNRRNYINLILNMSVNSIEAMVYYQTENLQSIY